MLHCGDVGLFFICQTFLGIMAQTMRHSTWFEIGRTFECCHGPPEQFSPGLRINFSKVTVDLFFLLHCSFVQYLGNFLYPCHWWYFSKNEILYLLWGLWLFKFDTSKRILKKAVLLVMKFNGRWRLQHYNKKINYRMHQIENVLIWLSWFNFDSIKTSRFNRCKNFRSTVV